MPPTGVQTEPSTNVLKLLPMHYEHCPITWVKFGAGWTTSDGVGILTVVLLAVAKAIW